MKIDPEIKESLCSYCSTKLQLIIETKEQLKANITSKMETPVNADPVFEIDFEEISEIEYTPYFWCVKCKMKSFDASKDLSYDELNDQLIYPRYNPEMKTGYSTFSFQYPFAPDFSPVGDKEEKLPTIIKVSSGEEIEKPVLESNQLMEGLGWE